MIPPRRRCSRLPAVTLVEISIGLAIMGVLALAASYGREYLRRARVMQDAAYIRIASETAKPTMNTQKLAQALHENKLCRKEIELDELACGGKLELEEAKLKACFERPGDARDVAHALKDSGVRCEESEENIKNTVTVPIR